MILTYRYRVRDGRGSDLVALRKQASTVNYVWNFLCETQRASERRWVGGAVGHWPSYFDLIRLTTGCSRELGINSKTIEAVCRSFVEARDKMRHCPRWRSARRNLDWIPTAAGHEHFRFVAGGVRYRGRRYRLWWSRPLPADAKVKEGAFTRDARGRWYLNATVETSEARPHGASEIGIDLGLRHLATLSSGEAIPNLRYTARYADAIAKASRARSKRRLRAIHAKITNSRRDHLHKISTRLMRTSRRVVVGNISPARLAKTRLAKSVLDAGWSSFRTMLAYKAIAHQVEYAEVDEAFTSRTCSACGVIPAGSPKGLGGLGIRRWICEACGAAHDRDVNAALNILRVGAERCPPAEEIAA